MILATNPAQKLSSEIQVQETANLAQKLIVKFVLQVRQVCVENVKQLIY